VLALLGLPAFPAGGRTAEMDHDETGGRREPSLIGPDLRQRAERSSLVSLSNDFSLTRSGKLGAIEPG
jgi:hypothetical protein